jgi:hypothetical protein
MRPSGERVVDIRTIKEAEKAVECQPSDQDVKGNWGEATNGFQLSLRFEKTEFTNGEPISAAMLMRNISGVEETYFRPIKIVIIKDGNTLKRKDSNGLIEINAPLIKTLFPQTQDKYILNICKIYDLSEPGKYAVQAVSGRPFVASKTVNISVRN